jgi:hypothetical protein
MPAPDKDIDERWFPFATPMQLEKLNAIIQHGGRRAAARALGINKNTIDQAVHGVEQKALSAGVDLKNARSIPRQPSAELDIPRAPDPNESIEDLIARKSAAYERLHKLHEFEKLLQIGVKTAGPVVIAAIGDPHVDDDRCDIAQLMDDLTVIGQTPGMFALHLGDITNNWVGRLGRLYAHQSTTAVDAIRLSEHIMKMAPPLAVVGGNHDLWNEGMSWLHYCVKQAGVNADMLKAHGARMALNFPGGQSIRIHARHDFPGHSQYNPVHGLAKEHFFGMRDHIAIAGHKHTDAIAARPSPEGYVYWTARVSGYKLHDDYAKQLNLQEMKMAPAIGFLIDPTSRVQAEQIKPFWDLREAAEVLTWKRARK